MAAAMPFAGSAYSWVNVLFGEFFWMGAGWALLAEYFIACSLCCIRILSEFTRT